YFDRKEVRNDPKKKLDEARNNITETTSAFTNSRGGTLVLGIDNSGSITGLNHLNENEFNSLTQSIFNKLTNHFVKTKEWSFKDKRLLIIYCPIGGTGICATNE